jgi:hypothetical protein
MKVIHYESWEIREVHIPVFNRETAAVIAEAPEKFTPIEMLMPAMQTEVRIECVWMREGWPSLDQLMYAVREARANFGYSEIYILANFPRYGDTFSGAHIT